MMKKLELMTLGTLALTPFALAAQEGRGAEVPQTGQRNQETQRADQQRLVKLSTLKGMAVHIHKVEEGESEKDKVADLADLIIDEKTGEARYALLSRGGIGGIGDTLIPVPVDKINASWRHEDGEMDEEPEIRLFTDLTEDRLSQAPEFEEDAWKGGRFAWDRVATYYGSSTGEARPRQGTEPGGEVRTQTASASMQGMFRLSEIIGCDVDDASGEKIADVENVILEPSTMKVSFVVLAYGGVLGIGDDLRAIPLSALRPTRNADGDVQIGTRLTKEQLEAAPKTDPDRWNEHGTKQFADKVKKDVRVDSEQR